MPLTASDSTPLSIILRVDIFPAHQSTLLVYSSTYRVVGDCNYTAVTTSAVDYPPLKKRDHQLLSQNHQLPNKYRLGPSLLRQVPSWLPNENSERALASALPIVVRGSIPPEAVPFSIKVDLSPAWAFRKGI